MSLIYLNGEFKPIEEASVNILDRGFIFGDGVYEVIPIFNRKIFRFDEHIRRLENSLKAIYMDNPLEKKDWHEIFNKLINSLEQSNQSIYLQVTRGVTKRDHDISLADKPTILQIIDYGKEQIIKVAGPDYKPAIPYHNHDHKGHKH